MACLLPGWVLLRLSTQYYDLSVLGNQALSFTVSMRCLVFLRTARRTVSKQLNVVDKLLNGGASLISSLNLTVWYYCFSCHKPLVVPWTYILLLLFSRSVLFSSLRSPWTVVQQVSWSFTVSQSLRKLMSIELVRPFTHYTFCYPLLLLSIFPSIRVFYNESVLPIGWPKYWSFSISPPNKCSGLISFRIEWFDLLAVQGTLKNLLQHHNLKASSVWHSAFFMVKCSHLYMTTG